MNWRVSVRGDGTVPRVAGLDPARPKAKRVCDRGELEIVVTQLLNRAYMTPRLPQSRTDELIPLACGTLRTKWLPLCLVHSVLRQPVRA